MNVGQLRDALEGLDERLEVVVRWASDDCSHVGGVSFAAVEHGCSAVAVFMVDGDEEVVPAPLTFDGKVVATEDDTGCGAQDANTPHYMCTLLPLHEGDHVAHCFDDNGYPESVEATWSTDDRGLATATPTTPNKPEAK